MSRADRAEELFRQGYNCGQSVFAAFADVLGMTVEELFGKPYLSSVREGHQDFEDRVEGVMKRMFAKIGKI